MPPGTPSQVIPDYNPTPGTPAQELADANPTPGAISLGIASPAEEFHAETTEITQLVQSGDTLRIVTTEDLTHFDVVGVLDLRGPGFIADGYYLFYRDGASLYITDPLGFDGPTPGATIRQVSGAVAVELSGATLVSGALTITTKAHYAWEISSNATFLLFDDWPASSGVADNLFKIATNIAGDNNYTAAGASAEPDDTFDENEVGIVYGPRRVTGRSPSQGQTDYNPTPGTPSDEVG